MDFGDQFIAIDEDTEFLPVISEEEIGENDNIEIKEALPVLALRNSVIFPGVIMPITVGRDSSIKAVRSAYRKDKLIGVLAQTNANEEDPSFDDLNLSRSIPRMVIAVVKLSMRLRLEIGVSMLPKDILWET